MWSGQWPGPEPAGSAGPGPQISQLCCGPGLDILFAGLIIQFAGRARAGYVQLLRARAGPRNFFPINAPGMGRFKLFNLVGYS